MRNFLITNTRNLDHEVIWASVLFINVVTSFQMSESNVFGE